MTASTDALEHTTLYTYTTAADAPQPPGLLKSTRSPLGLETAYTYDPYGQRLTATDAAQNTTSYTYDDLGRMETVTDPQGRTNWTCYDPAGRVTRTVANASGDGGTPATDPCDVVNYQPSNDPDYDRITTNLYDAVGNLIATTDDRGRTHRTYYDDANRVIAMVQNLSNWDVYTDTLPITSTRTITENLTTEMVYDLNSNMIATIDVGGKVTRTYYDTLNRPQFMVQNLTNWGIGETSPPPEYLRTVEENLTTETVYDLNGNIIATIGPDGVIDRTYYDELNRPILTVQNVASSWIYTDEMPTCNRDDGADSYICTETIYDPNGNVIATIDPAARITRTYYDELNRPQYMVQNLSNWDVYTDTLPVENLRTNSENLVTETVYNDDGQVIASIDPLGKITRTYYDDAGRPEIVVRNLTDHAIASDTPPDFDPDYPDQNVRTETVYDEYGRTIATIDPLGRVTRTYYDALDRPQYVVRNLTDHAIASDTPPDFDPDYPDQNVRTETVYDEYGRTIATIDPLDRVTRTYYDILDRPVVVVRNWDGVSIQDETPPQHNPAYPDRNIRSETIYDKDGMAIATVDTLGRITRTYFDGLGRPVTVVRNLVGQDVFTETPPSYDPDYPDQNVRAETEYDLAGRRVRISDNSGAATTFAYDDLGRQIGITDAISNTTTTVYDVLGQRVSTTDAKGIETYFEYDDLGRMAAVVENHQTGVNPNHEVNVRTEYTYDALGNRLTIRDANTVLNNTNDVTVFEYDGLGRLVSETDPLSHTTSYTYDAAGQRVSLTDAESATTIYGYDGLGRLTSTDYPNPDADVTFEYNAAGQRIEMSDGLGLTTWDYDLVGRPITITSAVTGTVGYGYDSVGNRIELVYPDSQTVNYAYDDLDRMIQVTDWDSGTTGYTYDSTGRLHTESLPNGVVITHTYNTVGWLLSLVSVGGGEVLSSFEYQYDSVGNRVQAAETLNQTGQQARLPGSHLAVQERDPLALVALSSVAGGETLKTDVAFPLVGWQHPSSAVAATGETTRTGGPAFPKQAAKSGSFGKIPVTYQSGEAISRLTGSLEDDTPGTPYIGNLSWTAISPDALVVNSLEDGADLKPGDGRCDDGNGACTLRAAIDEANALPGRQTIAFKLPDKPPYVIQPKAALPTITEPVILDGTTQEGYAGYPLVLLDGRNAGQWADGLTLAGGDSEVRGLAISQFERAGIYLLSDNNRIVGNFIGTDLAGARGAGNRTGVLVEDGKNNQIGGTETGTGNLISGNQVGVYLTGTGSQENRVQGNLIGPESTGELGIGNELGIRIKDAPANLIGGEKPEYGNLISGNHKGILVQGEKAQGNRVQGNRIGPKGSDRGDIGNREVGIWILDATGDTTGIVDNRITSSPVGIQAQGIRALRISRGTMKSKSATPMMQPS